MAGALRRRQRGKPGNGPCNRGYPHPADERIRIRRKERRLPDECFQGDLPVAVLLDLLAAAEEVEFKAAAALSVPFRIGPQRGGEQFLSHRDDYVPKFIPQSVYDVYIAPFFRDSDGGAGK